MIKHLNVAIQIYYLDYLVVLILALVLFSWLQNSPTLPEPDSFYHAKVAQFLSEGRVLHQLPWLQETELKDNFVDHHFLYHLLLVPFVKFINPLIGVKVATIVFASIAVLLVYWLFKKFAVKWPFLFIIALISSQPWLFRASLVKAPVVFLSLILLSFYSVSHYQYKLLALISFLSVWLYGGWPLIPALVILYVALVWLLEKIRTKESLWQKVKSFLHIKKYQIVPWPAVLYCFGGIIGGLVINPYFPQNLKFYWQQIIEIAVINQQSAISVGGEWYPYGLINLMADAPLACVLLALGLLAFILSWKKQSSFSWLWGLLAIIFFVLTLKSRRHVEFFIPFVVIFSAFCWSDFFKKCYPDFKKSLKTAERLIIAGLLTALALALAMHLPQDLLRAKNFIKNGWPLTRYQQAAEWLKNNTPQGAIVFNADWDDFPFLFYYGDHNYYLTGLDPTFMYHKNPAKYQQYVDVTLGKRQLELRQIIKNEFKADYVFLDTEHKAFEDKLKFSPDFLKVYADGEARVYQIK